MKTFISFFLFLFALNAFAAEEIAICEKEGRKYGDGNGNDTISAECIELFMKSAGIRQKDKSQDGNTEVYGYKNIILIRQKDHDLKIIAGKFTELENIKAVTLDDKNNEVAVLEESGDILVFSSVIDGNVGPKRVLRNKELDHVSDIQFYENEIAALDVLNQELHFFNRLANIHAPAKRRHLDPVRSVKGITGNLLRLDPVKNEVIAIVEQGE